jgi:hypothetical protein
MLYTKPEAGKPCVLHIGGRDLELRFTLKTLKALDVDHHLSVLKGEGLFGAMQDPVKLSVILYYGLRTKNPEITEDWVEENVDASMLLDMAPMLAFATTGRWPDLEKILADQKMLGDLPNPARPTPPPESNGSISGPLADTTSVKPN